MAFRSCLKEQKAFLCLNCAGQWNIFYIFGQRMQGLKFLNGKYMAKSVKKYIEENEEAPFGFERFYNEALYLKVILERVRGCLLYTSPSPRD